MLIENSLNVCESWCRCPEEQKYPNNPTGVSSASSTYYLSIPGTGQLRQDLVAWKKAGREVLLSYVAFHCTTQCERHEEKKECNRRAQQEEEGVCLSSIEETESRNSRRKWCIIIIQHQWWLAPCCLCASPEWYRATSHAHLGYNAKLQIISQIWSMYFYFSECTFFFHNKTFLFMWLTFPQHTTKKYFAHPQNAFWTIVASVFGFTRTQEPYERRVAWLTSAGFAVWDVLAKCHRKGSLDRYYTIIQKICNHVTLTYILCFTVTSRMKRRMICMHLWSSILPSRES